MTDLKKLADVALNRTRESLTRTRSGGFVFLLGFADGSMRTENLPDAVVAVLMGFDAGKEVLFGAMRKYAERENAEAVVFACESWVSKSTPAGSGYSREQWTELCRKHNAEELMRMGLVTRTEAISVTAQTADRVVTIMQPFRRDASGFVYSFAEPDVLDTTTHNMAGRIRMFGTE